MVGMHLPGKYCLYVSQTLNFKNPVFVGDTVVVQGTVRHKSDATQLVTIAVLICNQSNEVVAEGEAKVQVLM